ncbi:MAG: hypothetical protein EXR73_00740 [Myxococcales bacterium]|nr:hypothetical protein [Myxococcales bacterium]
MAAAARAPPGPHLGDLVTLPTLDALCRRSVHAAGPIVWLTGAGVSAESGIPTFRGEDGYWRVGARHADRCDRPGAHVVRRRRGGELGRPGPARHRLRRAATTRGDARSARRRVTTGMTNRA